MGDFDQGNVPPYGPPDSGAIGSLTDSTSAPSPADASEGTRSFSPGGEDRQGGFSGGQIHGTRFIPYDFSKAPMGPALPGGGYEDTQYLNYDQATELPALQDAIARGLKSNAADWASKVGFGAWDITNPTQLTPWLSQWSNERIKGVNDAIAAAQKAKTMSMVRGIGMLASIAAGGVGGAFAAPATAGGAAAGAGGGAGAGASLGTTALTAAQSGLTNAAINTAANWGLKGVLGGGWDVDWGNMLKSLALSGGLGGLTAGAGAGLTGSGIDPTLARIMATTGSGLVRQGINGKFDPWSLMLNAAQTGVRGGTRRA